MIMTATGRQGNVAVITGGSGFVGSAIVRSLLQKGWKVAALSRRGTGPKGAELYACDVTDAKEVDAAIRKIVSEHGTIDACIHAAAPALSRVPILSTTTASFDETVEAALHGAFYLARSAVPHMPRGSVFIGVTSDVAEHGGALKGMGAYVPAKYAFRGFLRALYSELEQKGIRVNAVAPGFLAGGLNDDLPAAVLDFVKKKEPNASAGSVADIVEKICCDHDAFASGTSIAIDGEVTPL